MIILPCDCVEDNKSTRKSSSTGLPASVPAYRVSKAREKADSAAAAPRHRLSTRAASISPPRATAGPTQAALR